MGVKKCRPRGLIRDPLCPLHAFQFSKLLESTVALCKEKLRFTLSNHAPNPNTLSCAVNPVLPCPRCLPSLLFLQIPTYSLLIQCLYPLYLLVYIVRGYYEVRSREIRGGVPGARTASQRLRAWPDLSASQFGATSGVRGRGSPFSLFLYLLFCSPESTGILIPLIRSSAQTQIPLNRVLSL